MLDRLIDMNFSQSNMMCLQSYAKIIPKYMGV